MGTFIFLIFFCLIGVLFTCVSLKHSPIFFSGFRVQPQNPAQFVACAQQVMPSKNPVAPNTYDMSRSAVLLRMEQASPPLLDGLKWLSYCTPRPLWVGVKHGIPSSCRPFSACYLRLMTNCKQLSQILYEILKMFRQNIHDICMSYSMYVYGCTCM